MGLVRRAAIAAAVWIGWLAAGTFPASAQNLQPGQRVREVDPERAISGLQIILTAIGFLIVASLAIPIGFAVWRKKREEAAITFMMGLLPIAWLVGSLVIAGIVLGALNNIGGR